MQKNKKGKIPNNLCTWHRKSKLETNLKVSYTLTNLHVIKIPCVHSKIRKTSILVKKCCTQNVTYKPSWEYILSWIVIIDFSNVITLKRGWNDCSSHRTEKHTIIHYLLVVVQRSQSWILKSSTKTWIKI